MNEALCVAILRVLDANHTMFGLQVEAITTHLVQYGFTPKHEEVLSHVEYLENKGLANQPAKLIAKQNRAWRITDGNEGGRAYLDKLGF